MEDIVKRLQDGIQLYSACLEDGPNHIQRIADAIKEITTLRAKLAKANEENAALRELLNEIAVAGVPFDDPRIDYVEIQVDKDTMTEIRTAIDDAKGGE